MSVVALFYEALRQGRVPLVVPVRHEGEEGVFVIGGQVGPGEIVPLTHPDLRVRAKYLVASLRNARRAAAARGLVVTTAPPLGEDALYEECRRCEGFGCGGCRQTGYVPHGC